MAQASIEQAVATQVSNDIAGLYKDIFGRGPKRTRTYWCGTDVLTVVLEDTLTQAERALVAIGAHAQLRDTRTVFQDATLKQMCQPVERATGRKVRAVVTGTDSHVDGLSVETFVLHPDGYDGPSRTTFGGPVG